MTTRLAASLFLTSGAFGELNFSRDSASTAKPAGSLADTPFEQQRPLSSPFFWPSKYPIATTVPVNTPASSFLGGGALAADANGGLFAVFANSSAPHQWEAVAVTPPLKPGALLLKTAGDVLAAVDAAGLHLLSCNFSVYTSASVPVAASSLGCTSTALFEPLPAACFSSLSAGGILPSQSQQQEAQETVEVVIGCGPGLYSGTASLGGGGGGGVLERVALADDEGPATRVAVGHGGWLAVATPTRLHLRYPTMPAAGAAKVVKEVGTAAADWWWEWISEGDPTDCNAFDYSGGAVEANVTDMAFMLDSSQTMNTPLSSSSSAPSPGYLVLGSEMGMQVLDLGTNALQRYGRLDGLPYSNITQVATFPYTAAAAVANAGEADYGLGGGVYVATTSGLVRWLPGKGFSVFHSQRWLGASQQPASAVAASCSLGSSGGGGGGPGHTLVLVGPGGSSTLISTKATTLYEKAKLLQAAKSPRHDRYGYVAACGLKMPGDLSSYVLHDSDNDGLWTSMYAASQVFRFHAELAQGNEEEAQKALAEVEETVKALMFLFSSSGDGSGAFVARSATKAGDTIYSGGTWHNSTTKPGWVWKGDTSSDEITGHMFIYPLVQALVPALNASLLSDVKSNTHQLVKGLIASNFTLIDPATDKPTTWGLWTPEVLNSRRSWSDNRGLRALELQTYLLAAEQMTGDPIFPQTFQALRQQHRYDRMMVNCKITAPCDDNHSDDEETFLPLYTYFSSMQRLGRPPDAAFNATARRLCRVTLTENDSLYAAMCAFMLDESPPDSITDDLRGWPVDLINWSVQNSGRLDVWPKPIPLTAQESTHPIKRQDSVRFVWNANPFSMDAGSQGNAEQTPTGYLLAYWLARFHGFLEAPK